MLRINKPRSKAQYFFVHLQAGSICICAKVNETLIFPYLNIYLFIVTHINSEFHFIPFGAIGKLEDF